MVMSKVKLAISGALAETLNVSTAWVTEEAANEAFCLSQATVKFPEAACGFQLPAVIVNVTGTVVLFLTYIVWVTVLPGFKIPQLMVVTVFVQLISENTPTPTAATPVVLEKVRE